MRGHFLAPKADNERVMGSPRPVALRLIAFVVVFGVAASACSGSGYAYHKDPTGKNYFKLPSDWETFDTEDILRASGVSPQALEFLPRVRWMVGFDADPQKPDIRHIFNSDADYPTGLAQVRVLLTDERESFSTLSLRDAFFDLNSEELTGIVQILDEQEFVLSGGYRGVRLTYNESQGGAFLTVSQVAVVDPGTQLMYSFAVGCGADCYLANESTIDQIVDSWTVRQEG